MGTCVQIYVLLYECVYVHTYVLDPVRLRLRHLYEVKCLRVDDDGPGWGHLYHIETFLVLTKKY